MRYFLFILILLSLCACDKPKSSYQGYIEGENIYLMSPYSGHLEKAYVTRGQKVSKGDLLYSLDNNPQKFTVNSLQASVIANEQSLTDMIKPRRPQQLQALKARIEQVQARIELAKIRVNRFKTLYQQNAGNKDSFDAATSLLERLQGLFKENEANLELAGLGARINQIKSQAAQVYATQFKLDNARWQLEQKQIYAPEDGYIYDVYYREGEFVGAQRPIAALLAPRYVLIEFFVPLPELNNLQVGTDIEFNYQSSKEFIPAKVSYVAPKAEFLPPLIYSRQNSNKIVFRIKARVPNDKSQLFPGLPVTVRIKNA